MGIQEEHSRNGPSVPRKLLKQLGPGFITGASDDDPSGIGTYAVAGASLGYALLWTLPFTLPLMFAAQYLSARIALVTGQGLAGVLREHFPRPVLYAAVGSLLVANTINVGADLGAIAEALHILVPVPREVYLPLIAALILIVQILGSYQLIARVFKVLTLALLGYIGSSFFARPDLFAVLKGTLFPEVSGSATYWSTLVAVLGTTISPYLFFWQSDQEIEHEEAEGRGLLLHEPGISSHEVMARTAWDTGFGMAMSNVVAYFIVLSTAASLHVVGLTQIQSATEAAQALRPLVGAAAQYLFAAGLIGSGFLAVPVLSASAAYAVSEALEWRGGLNKRFAEARKFYALIVASTLVGLGMNYLGINPIQALFWTAVLNGFTAPPLLLLVMLVSRNERLMGQHTPGLLLTFLGWLTTAVMLIAAIVLVVVWTQG